MIGINGRVAVRFGNRVNTGVGYAIPANQIKNFLDALRKGGVVSHGILKGIALDARYPQGKGPVVARVTKDSEADLAGFKRGDRILSVHDHVTPSQNRFAGVLGIYPAGAVVPIRVRRGKKELVLRAKLTARESRSETASTNRNPNAPFLGVEFSLEHEGTGVEIEKVVTGSSAEKAGIQAGDILLGFEGTEIRNAQHLIHLISRRKVGDKVQLQVQRGNQVLKLTATLMSRNNQ